MIRTRLATAEDVYVACENPLPIFQNGHDHTLGLLAAVDKGLALALEDQFNNLCGVVSIAVMPFSLRISKNNPWPPLRCAVSFCVSLKYFLNFTAWKSTSRQTIRLDTVGHER